MNNRKRMYMLVICALACTAAIAAQSTATTENKTQAQKDSGAKAAQDSEGAVSGGQGDAAAGGQSEAPVAGGQGDASGESAASTETGRVNEEELAIGGGDSPEVQLESGLNNFTVWDFLRMFLVLGGVIASIYGVFFFLKKMGNPKYQSNSLISILSTQNLQGNRALHLVEIGKEVFLVGSSEGGVELVGKIEEQQTLDQIRLYHSEMNAGGVSFQQSIKEIFKGSSEGVASEEGFEESGENNGLFLRKQRERLKNL